MICGCCKIDVQKRGFQPKHCVEIELMGLKKKDPLYLCSDCDRQTLEDREKNFTQEPEGA